MRFPQLARIRQEFQATRVDDVEGRVVELLAGFRLAERITPGARIALTAGSRGIRDMARVLRTLAAGLSAAGARPFVAPCMGSHGGATPQGQIDVLASLGITEKSVGAPIVSSLETVSAATSRFGEPVLVGRDLAEADGIVVVNRIKPHTDFAASVESGLVKMMVIGMGKEAGASLAHNLTLHHGHEAIFVEYASRIMGALPVLFGIGIIENQLDEACMIELLEPVSLIERERELLVIARERMAQLPFDQVDVLVIDEIGKDISGAGMDPNITGRRTLTWTEPPPRPRVTRIFPRGLSVGTHGNASGIGAADVTTRRLVDAIDWPVTIINCLAAAAPEDGKLPLAFECDRDALAACIGTCGRSGSADVRLVWIRSTLALEDIVVSEALLPEASGMAHIRRVGEPFDLRFDADGNADSPVRLA